MKRSFIIIILFAVFSFAVKAQDSGDVKDDHIRNIYNQCEQAYKIGQFDEAYKMLNANLRLFNGSLKVNALRLLSLCCLNQDNKSGAELYASQLLNVDPSFSVSMESNQRFIDLIESMKKGSATITSASQIAETIEEVPVPTTLITDEMIKMSGAKNLAELLCLYVPGISLIDGYDMNVTMHGAYSMFQEKILVLLNGHRLNSRTTNSESLDFRHSLDKIKQIEVLRGPASSLYGNVALTAVVNIITKQGIDVDGVEIKGGIGNNKTYQGSILFGKRYLDVDFLAWASIYASDGEKRVLNPGDDDYYSITGKPGYMYVGRWNETPSYDLGISAKYSHFNFLLTHQKSKKVLPYSNLLQFGLYDYDHFVKIDGNKPGTVRENTRFELSYDNNFENLFFHGKAFAEVENASNYWTMGDSLSKEGVDYFNNLVFIDGFSEGEKATRKYPYEIPRWNNYTFGAIFQVGYNYQIGSSKGTLLGGIQYEYYLMNDTYYMIGESDSIHYYLNDSHRTLLLGNEYNLSGYFQIKHHILPSLIFNGGLRYDYKHQFNNNYHVAWSPRVSLIWNPNERLNFKTSYSHSFVDAPYYYRANATSTYEGASELSPETMDAVQFTMNYKSQSLGLSYEGNIFYNAFHDLITLDQGKFVNAGSFRIAGIENVFSYKKSRHTASLNMTYQSVLNFKNYTATGNHVFAVPNFMGNVIYNINLFKGNPYGALDIHANILYKGKVISRMSTSVFEPLEEITIASNAIVNMGFDYSWKQFELSCLIYNLFNTNYNLASNQRLPIPQLGRNFMATVKVNL